MAYQCNQCNSYTADGQKHDCVYDELARLKLLAESYRVKLIKILDLCEERGHDPVEIQEVRAMLKSDKV